jgi:predicted GIY-YIG superfamily endonuclease
MARTSTVYLLHLSERVAGHAGHYMGSTTDLQARLAQHRSGQGARLLEVCRERGITFELARTWRGGRELERRLKAWNNGPRLCPLCRARRKEKGEPDGC